MTYLIVNTREGETLQLEPANGDTVMAIIRNAGADEPFALCGGCLSCATCHVIVDPADMARLPPAKSEEEDLLAGLDGRTPTSRLSCQIGFDERLSGLRVRIAPEE